MKCIKRQRKNCPERHLNPNYPQAVMTNEIYLKHVLNKKQKQTKKPLT